MPAGAALAAPVPTGVPVGKQPVVPPPEVETSCPAGICNDDRNAGEPLAGVPAAVLVPMSKGNLPLTLSAIDIPLLNAVGVTQESVVTVALPEPVVVTVTVAGQFAAVAPPEATQVNDWPAVEKISAAVMPAGSTILTVAPALRAFVPIPSETVCDQAGEATVPAPVNAALNPLSFWLNVTFACAHAPAPPNSPAASSAPPINRFIRCNIAPCLG